jgi:hypothetical protein
MAAAAVCSDASARRPAAALSDDAPGLDAREAQRRPGIGGLDLDEVGQRERRDGGKGVVL